LDRSNLVILLTGIVGGLEVSLGALAAMLTVGSALTAMPGLPLCSALALGALAFPIGLVFVIFGRSGLFTETLSRSSRF
jgi:formate/nitrite transporter FocA (FNT family)